MLQRLLRSPMKVFFLSLVFACGSLVLNGGWVNLYSLHRDQLELHAQIQKLHGSLHDLDLQLVQAKDPSFIERQAMDQLDMASDRDLVFVFSE